MFTNSRAEGNIRMFLCSYPSIVFQSKDGDSKYQLAGSLEKKTLALQEKIKFLDYAEANEKLGCRKIADVFKIGKTAANNILKNKQISTNIFMTKLRNAVGQENMSLSVISYMSCTKNAAPQIFILMALY